MAFRSPGLKLAYQIEINTLGGWHFELKMFRSRRHDGRRRDTVDFSGEARRVKPEGLKIEARLHGA